jgi:hypothetical protein
LLFLGSEEDKFDKTFGHSRRQVHDIDFLLPLNVLLNQVIDFAMQAVRPMSSRLPARLELSNAANGLCQISPFRSRPMRHHAPFLPRRSLAVATCLAYLPGMTADQTDYSVVVKHRASPPKPWRWEIYRAGRSNPVAQSSVYFETMTLANKAGKEALK